MLSLDLDITSMVGPAASLDRAVLLLPKMCGDDNFFILELPCVHLLNFHLAKTVCSFSRNIVCPLS